MDFEEWYREAKKTNDCGFTAKDFFEAGQKSKQAEIDVLKAKLEEVKNHAFINYDHERDDDHHSYWSGYNVAMCEFVDIIKGEEE